MALPLLDSMSPALTALAQTAAAPVRRLGVFYVPNGMSMPYWWPKTEGPIGDLPATLTSVSKHRDRLLLCGGLADEAANLVKGGGDHARSAGTFLTCIPFKITAGADVFAAVSMDQVAAAEFAKHTQLASLELGIESNAMLGACEAARAAPIPTPSRGARRRRRCRSRTIRAPSSSGCLARPGAPTPGRGWIGSSGTAASSISSATKSGGWVAPSGRRTRRRSTNTSRRCATSSAASRWPRSKRARAAGGRAAGRYTDRLRRAREADDHLPALSYQTDLTRISTFMLAREVSGRAYPEIGVTDSLHPLSHHQDESAKLERLHKINEYHFRQFAYLVDKLAAMPEGDGTMLDHTLFLYGTGISDSNTHFHDDLPIALIGGTATGIRADATFATRKAHRSRTCISPSSTSWVCGWTSSAIAPAGSPRSTCSVRLQPDVEGPP